MGFHEADLHHNSYMQLSYMQLVLSPDNVLSSDQKSSENFKRIRKKTKYHK